MSINIPEEHILFGDIIKLCHLVTNCYALFFLKMIIPAPPTAIIASRTKNIAIPVFGGVVPGGVVGGVVIVIV